MHIDSSPIIECNVDKIEVQQHNEIKDQLMHVVNDLYKSNVNYNTS